MIYRPKELKVIIDANEREEVLKTLFDDERTGVGAGIKKFDNTVCSNSLNTKKKDFAQIIKEKKVKKKAKKTRSSERIS